MSEEILINVTPVETRVALVENGMLQEAYIERASRKGIVGNIYKGKVVRVLPGMEAAFVDIGLERAAFIHASDVVSNQSNAADSGDGPKTVPDIRTLLREGQSLVVQVTKDPIGTKAPGSPLSFPYPPAIWFLCPTSVMWVFPRGLKTRPNAPG